MGGALLLCAASLAHLRPDDPLNVWLNHQARLSEQASRTWPLALLAVIAVCWIVIGVAVTLD